MARRGVLALLLLGQMAAAQDTIRFDKALAVQSGSRYGREAIYTDLLSYQLFNNRLQPSAGALFHKNGQWRLHSMACCNCR